MPHIQSGRVVDAKLTGLAQSYSQADLVFHKLFPIVDNLDKESGKIPKFGKEQFRLNKTERGMRAKGNRLNWEFNTPIPYTMGEHNIEFPYDNREAEEAGDTVNLDKYGTKVTTESIGLRIEKYCADLAQNLSNYAASNKVTLGSGATWTLTDAATVDPVVDVEVGRAAIEDGIVKSPNVGVFGPVAWRLFKNHPKVIARLSANSDGILTLEKAAELLELDEVVVGKALYINDANAGVKVWGANFIMAYVPQVATAERTEYDPSYGYTLRKNGYPEVDKREEDGMLQLVRSRDILTSILCGADAGYIINAVD